MLSVAGVGTRGRGRADVADALEAVPVDAPFALAVGRDASAADLDAYDGPSKDDLRRKIWDKLEKEDLADFPRPCQHRIPNFKGWRGVIGGDGELLTFGADDDDEIRSAGCVGEGIRADFT